MATKDIVQKVLEGRRRGYPYSAIAQSLGITERAAEKAFEEGLSKESPITDPEQMLRLDLSRLDRMTQGLWPEASSGNPAAVREMLSVMEARRRTLAAPPTTTQVDAFNASLEGLTLTKADGALIELGRKIAARIDAASGSFDPIAETKAMYLSPHLVTVLRELGATPAVRAQNNQGGREEKGGKLASLRALRDAEKAAG